MIFFSDILIFLHKNMGATLGEESPKSIGVAKLQASLHLCAVLPEPILFAYLSGSVHC